MSTLLMNVTLIKPDVSIWVVSVFNPQARKAGSQFRTLLVCMPNTSVVVRMINVPSGLRHIKTWSLEGGTV